MKKIIFLHHAKSKRNRLLNDFDRPLSKKGIMDAKSMINCLSTFIGEIDLLLSSSSQRAKKTLKHIYLEKYKTVTFTKSPYHADKKFII